MAQILEPYEILKVVSRLERYERLLGIFGVKIFESVEKSNEIADTVLGTTITTISGAAYPFGILGTAQCISCELDLKQLHKEQLERLANDPFRIKDEIRINLLLSPCIEYSFFCSEQMKKGMSDAAYVGLGIFSQKKREKWETALCARILERVRKNYVSTLLLIINYIILCEQKGFEYDVIYLNALSQYLARTLYYNCDEIFECFIIDYKNYLSDHYRYIDDLLRENSSPICLYEPIPVPNAKTKEIFCKYTQGEARDKFLIEAKKRLGK